MKKKLFLELKTLAQEILLLDDPEEVNDFRERIKNIHDQLIVIDFLENNPGFSIQTESESEIKTKIGQVSDKIELEDIIKPNDTSFALENENDSAIEVEQKDIVDQHVENEALEDKNSNNSEDLFVPTFDSIKDDFSQKEEFKDTISLDETEKLFDTKKESDKPLSLNDRLVKNSLQVGLNDRIAFVNNLFNFSQLEFNKVLNTLENFESERDAKNYIQHTLKNKYNWTGKEDIEERFVLMVEKKFL